MTIPAPARRILAALAAAPLVLAACGDDGDTAGSSSSTSAGQTTTIAAGSTTTAPGVTVNGITPERCAANKAAGKITYLSGFDFAASAGIVEVVAAAEKGYFQKMCLDVELKSSFSTANYPLVAANQAQFASAGSYSEMLSFASKNDAKFVAVWHGGKTGIDALLVKPDSVFTPAADVKGKTIGVKGTLTASVQAMLSKAGLKEGADYKTVLLDGFDPKVHMQQPVDGFPVFKSNEPGQLTKAGIPFNLLDPAAQGIPGSFGVVYTNAKFASDHPTAVQDFVRASMKGLADAIADPKGAVAICITKIKEGGNKNFLSDEGETYRWQVEARLVVDSSKGEAIGLIDPALLQTEVDALTAAGYFTTKPSIDGSYDAATVASVYDTYDRVIWPAS